MDSVKKRSRFYLIAVPTFTFIGSGIERRLNAIKCLNMVHNGNKRELFTNIVVFLANFFLFSQNIAKLCEILTDAI